MSSSSSPFLVPRTSSMPCTPTSYSILNPSANSFERHWPPASKRLPIRVLTSVHRNKRYWAGRVTRAAWNWTRLAVYHVLYTKTSMCSTSTQVTTSLPLPISSSPIQTVYSTEDGNTTWTRCKVLSARKDRGTLSCLPC